MIFFWVLCCGLVVVPIWATLRATDSDIFEGPCRSFNPAPVTPDLVHFFQSPPRPQFTTYGSQSHFRLVAESFLGRPAHTQAEINGLCPTYLLTGSTVTHIMFGNKVYVTNGVQDPPLVFRWPFPPLAKSRGVSDLSYNSTVIWTHPAGHLLFVDCADNFILKWKLVSNTLPTTEIKTEVLNTIERAGFKKSLTWDMTNLTQTGSGTINPCYLTPPSLPEFGVEALLGLNLFEDDSPLHRPLNEEVGERVIFGGKLYDTLAQYYGDMLKPIISHFVQEAIEHCGRQSGVNSNYFYDDGSTIKNSSSSSTKLSLGCQLLTSNL